MSNFVRNSFVVSLSGSESKMSLRVEFLGKASMANCLSGIKLKFLSGPI